MPGSSSSDDAGASGGQMTNSLTKFNTDWDDSGDEEDKEETEKTVEEKKRLLTKVRTFSTQGQDDSMTLE